MTNQNDIDAMAKILGNMKAAESGEHTVTKASAGEADAMADVLQRLQEATSGAAYNVVNESRDNKELDMALNTQKIAEGVSISRYDIRAEKKIVQEGLKKTFYNIVDNKTGKVVHSDLGLFESAMGIVKHMLYTRDDNRVNRILQVDQEYTGAVMETYGYKKRLSRLDESSVQHDVASAKYSNSKSKMQAAKMKLLKVI